MIKLFLNDIDLKTTYGAVLESFNIGVPNPRITQITIPGRSGALDYSTALTGAIAYDNRKISCTLTLHDSEEAREEKRKNLVYAFSGQMCQIKFSHLDGYFEGRCIVKGETRNRPLYRTELTIEFDCYPYRTLEDGSEIL